MKIVINNQYGGFSVSREALLRLRDLGEKTALSETDYGEMFEDGSGPRKPFGQNSEGDFCRSIPRDSPELVQVVEKLGKDANGEYAHLKVVEIPDGVDWYIDEYDGIETIHEQHKSWK